jgi:ubiquinone/menaquinone biosynthesis C-methylase UbiE
MFYEMPLRKIFDFNQFNRDMWVKEKAMQIPRGSKVLDAGAGTGRYRNLFLHCDYKALDFCKEPSTIGHYIKMDFVCDVTSIPVPSESIDVILCTEVLEHVPEPIKVIKEFSRILKKGGTLLLTAPLGCGIHQQPFIYYGGFTPYWYMKFLTEYVFKDIKITPNGGFFKHYGQESQRFISYIFPSSSDGRGKLLFLPLKIMASGFFRIFIPILCHALDRMDKDKHFTVGYFVEAKKK